MYQKNKSEKELDMKPQLLKLSVDELSEVVGGYKCRKYYGKNYGKKCY